MENTPRLLPARRASRNSLLSTVAVATLAAAVVFGVFYVIGAVVGLAVVAVAGLAVIAGLAWLAIRSRSRVGSPRASTPMRRG